MLADPPDEALLARVASDPDAHAPHVIDVEVVHSLRRLARISTITLERAEAARLDFADLNIARYPHVEILDRMWELRDNLSAYDAAFVALAELLDVPLVTTDGRLARAPGHRADIELYPRVTRSLL